MAHNGLYINLHNDNALDVYLENQVYGQHIPVDECGDTPSQKHYKILADYSCARDGTHVFFFINRAIYYGGQVRGSKNHGAFYLNGSQSPLGKEANAPLAWDESELYSTTNKDGIFTRNSGKRQCQPYLIRFEDRIGLQGYYIRSDEFYYKLADYRYLLPGNVISGMGFCTLTPGETEDLLTLIREGAGDYSGQHRPNSQCNIDLTNPVRYRPKYDIDSIYQAQYEAHLEAALAANPDLRPQPFQNGASVCRQVPISPPRPDRIDQADLCFYPEEAPEEGRIPQKILELKRPKNPDQNKRGVRADAREGEKIVRYLDALHGLIGTSATDIEVTVLADRFSDGSHHLSKPPYFTEVIRKYDDRITQLTHDTLQQRIDSN